jgi:hypothetical protein
MLVCNVSQRARRAAIAADIAEAAAASDVATQGHVVFATLVDDPANVRDRVDAYLGEIMLEAAAAASTVNAGLTYGAAIVEAVTALDTAGGTVPGVFAATLAETAAAADTSDSTITGAVPTLSMIVGTSPAFASVPVGGSGEVAPGVFVSG